MVLGAVLAIEGGGGRRAAVTKKIKSVTPLMEEAFILESASRYAPKVYGSRETEMENELINEMAYSQ